MKKWLSVFFILATISLSAQEKIYAPSLTAPAAGAINQRVNVALDWNPVSGGVKYEFQLDTSSIFSNPQQHVVAYSAWQSSELLFNTVYYWHVRAIDAASDTSSWSVSRSFTTVAYPTLKTPAIGFSAAAVTHTVFWKTFFGVSEFQCQIDTVNTFDSPFLMTGHTVNDSSYLATNLLYGDTAFWRVRGIHSNDTSDWSISWRMITRDSITPLSPAANAVGVSPKDTIVFESIYGTTGYDIEFDTDNMFSSSDIFQLDSSAIQIAKYNTKMDTVAKGIMQNFGFGETYYWRARLRNAVDTSNWSLSSSFTTVDEVNMVSPADNDIDVVVTTSFKWNSILGITDYILEYDTSSLFSAPTVVNVSDTVYTPASNLLSQTDYFWRVRAISDIDTTSLWDEYTFKTYFGVGIEESSNASWSVYPNPTNGVFYLTIDAASSARMEILNVLGDVVMAKSGLSNGSNMISIDNLNNGIYMMRLVIDGTTYTSRIIKK